MMSTALIIADGFGEFNSHNSYNAYKKIFGIALVARVIKNASLAGFKTIRVVTSRASDVTEALKSLKIETQIEVIADANASASLGLSLLKYSEDFKEGFVALSGNVFLDVKNLEMLANLKFASPLGMADKTSVKESGFIAVNASGRDWLKQYSTLADLEKLTHTLRDANLLDITPIDLPNEAVCFENKAGEKRIKYLLMQACRKPADGFVSRTLNRPISLFISSKIAWLPVSPNAWSFLILIVGVMSGVFAMKGSYLDFAIAGFLFHSASVLDGVDGEIAKYKYAASKLGQWVDTFCDNTTLILFMVGTAIGLSRMNHPWLPIVGPVAISGLCFLLVIMFTYLAKFSDSGSLQAIQKDFEARQDLSWFSKTIVKLNALIKRDFFAFFFMLLTFVKLPHFILLLTGVATHVAWIFIVKEKFLKRSK